MPWTAYWAVLRRRWVLVAIVLALDILASLFLFYRSYHKVGFQGCLTLYVADVSSPSVTLETTDQLLAGETAANFFGDDILDVAQSGAVAQFLTAGLDRRGFPDAGSVSVSGARKDRTVGLCVSAPRSDTALAAAGLLGRAMTSQRARFIGTIMARRTYVRVISSPTAGRAPTSHDLVNLGLRVILGLVLAVGLAFLWDALDPDVRGPGDVEASLGAPVLATVQ